MPVKVTVPVTVFPPVGAPMVTPLLAVDQLLVELPATPCARKYNGCPPFVSPLTIQRLLPFVPVAAKVLLPVNVANVESVPHSRV